MKVPKKWQQYTKDKSYLRLSVDLISPSVTTLETDDLLIRNELYNMWTEEEINNEGCTSSSNKIYQGAKHSNGNNPPLDRCFEALENSSEYMYLGEHFLIEYENCLKIVDEENFHSLLTTICLDTIAIRRLIIEYNLCCGKDSSVITSTLCEFENFNTMYSNHNLSTLNYLANRQNPLVSSVGKLCVSHILTTFLCVFYIIFNCWKSFY